MLPGIVFSVRPPKKSWKNIANLSGGEKTLSSLALVFALHHYKYVRGLWWFVCLLCVCVCVLFWFVCLPLSVCQMDRLDRMILSSPHTQLHTHTHSQHTLNTHPQKPHAPRLTHPPTKTRAIKHQLTHTLLPPPPQHTHSDPTPQAHPAVRDGRDRRRARLQERLHRRQLHQGAYQCMWVSLCISIYVYLFVGRCCIFMHMSLSVHVGTSMYIYVWVDVWSV
jgi:hypothetical protein